MSIDAQFSTFHPATGERFGEYPITSDEEVASAVARARAAAAWWSGLSFGQRRRILRSWNSLLIERLDDAVELIVAESGKPRSDAQLEAALACEHVDWAARKAQFYLHAHHRYGSTHLMSVKPLSLHC